MSKPEAKLVILARHGNTFESPRAAVFVGARSDLPLVDAGRKQAQDIAAALDRLQLRPGRIVSGPLKRTAETAAIIASHLKVPAPTIDIRLREIDYGTWEGLSKSEIASRYGERPLAAYEGHGEWPDGAGWIPARADMVADIATLFKELNATTDRVVLLVTSNAILRLMAEHLSPHLDLRGMRTGYISLVEFVEDRGTVVAWNAPPSAVVI